MTYKQWEGELLSHLKTLPEIEQHEAAEYYREIFSDKFDAGIEENKILREFGDPKIAAERILAERDDSETEAPIKEEKPESKVQNNTATAKIKKISISKWVGIFFLTTLVFIPLASIAISVIAAFGAVTVSAGALVIGGLVGAIASPLALILSYTGMGVLSAAGACLALAGVGAILLPVFFVITKYCVIVSVKLTKYSVRRCKQ